MTQKCGIVHVIVMLGVLLCSSSIAQAGAPEGYQQAVGFAAQGHEREAVAALSVLAEVLPDQSVWGQRVVAAKQLIVMKMSQDSAIHPIVRSNPYLVLAITRAENQPHKYHVAVWPVGVLAALFPGAGHAWQGRWSDAKTAALMVWPMLLLTLWAFKRGMGPVTVFFALMTVWLWSGTVFSAISLAERGSVEAYLLWWQGVWQASGLPGRPW